MKHEEFFLKKTKEIFAKKNICKLNKFIKDNALIIPLIYIIGTIMLLIRNKEFGLPFSPISLIQFSIIIVYLVVTLSCYSLINFILVDLVRIIKEKNSLKNKLSDISGISISLSFVYIMIFAILSLIVVEQDEILILLFSYFILLPIALMVIIINSKIPLLNYFIVIIFYMTIVLFIPISLGGFRGQKIYFCNEISKCDEEYTFYGVVDGMYQLSDEKNIYLVPIDKGYIKYHKN